MNLLVFTNQQAAEARNNAETIQRGCKVNDSKNITKSWWSIYRNENTGEYGLHIRDRRHVKDVERLALRDVGDNNSDWYGL